MYYQKIAIAISVAGILSTVFGASDRDYKSEARETFRRTFSGDTSLDVDNVNGTIHVIGDGGTTIRVEAEKITRAIDQRELERGKRDVTLDVNERDGIAQLYVNGPFRDNGHSSEYHGFHFHNDRDYEVTYDFTIRVPRDTGLRLRTVTGDVKTEQTGGRFDVHSVNGGITMTQIAGSGTARTVNGATTITFRENPKTASDFQSVNGTLDVGFQPNLAADIRVKTLNGQAYTDFDSTLLLSPASGVGERRNGKLIYRARDHFSSVRVGAGGPDLRFETVNGDIRIRKEAR